MQAYPKPRARTQNLIVTEVEQEVLVYDLTDRRIHALEPAAALVWQHCDGRHDTRELAALLGAKLELAPDDSLVWLALAELQEANLLSEPTDAPSRRNFLKTMGMATAAAGLASVVSLTAPAPAAAQSFDLSTSDCGADPDHRKCLPPWVCMHCTFNNGQPIDWCVIPGETSPTSGGPPAGFICPA